MPEQDSSQPPPSNTVSQWSSGLLNPLRFIQGFEGLPAQPHEETLRRRRPNAASDPETTPSIPLQDMNDAAEPTSLDSEDDSDEASRLSHAQQHLIVILTVNRVCRIITIIALGFWEGWSIMPAETKSPASVIWVTYICIITDWVVLSTALDCTFPKSMNWYFRRWPEWSFLEVENMPRVTVTGYSILNTMIGLGIAIFEYVLQSNQPIINRTNVIYGSIVVLGLYWLGRVESSAESPGAWFFYTNYGPYISRMFSGVKFIYALTTWWWIAFRIHGVVKILRNRNNPEMAVQLYILITGLAVELVFLLWYFSIPLFSYFLKRWHWNHRLWYEHLPPLLAMLLSWVLVVVFGLWVELPNIFFPCSGSTSLLCRALIT
ncbi:hypothetical protein HYPSUDRAFT_46050 [Hypholoma sublateritium FD-334 SS-4]|uniref:Uncharacterized protein n=1 Tax=Hypholoma sublateritium (strain FD-334 SS-4) TaxID=945553 RepID=A0A0D2M3I2_HYPSF|nr:hypothetical protein HYPSUDRAFT_46050 [Hypholoma sublateritium FD-334 SS-4]